MSATAKERRVALLGEHTSRINKLWCAIGWGVEWKLMPDQRLAFLFDGKWSVSKSYEQDYAPKLELTEPRRFA